MKEKCKNCRWYEGRPGDKERSKWGRCHRYPPNIVGGQVRYGDYEALKGLLGYDEHYIYNRVWVEVYSSEGCGEFTEK